MLKNQMIKMFELEEFAQGLGFSPVRLFLARDIVVDERVRMQCRVNLCGNYNKNLMCPPYLPPLEEVQKTINRYTFALLVILKIAGTDDSRLRDIFHQQALILNEKLIRLERQAFALGFTMALGLPAGECKLCDTCAINLDSEHCRFPASARPSMEGMGINVLVTGQRNDISLSFVPGELKMAGLLLID